MSKSSDRHVVPTADGKWAVRAGNGKRASSVHLTQEEAIDAAQEIIRHAGGGELVVHSVHGSIRDSGTVWPGNDPFPPRDRK